MLIMLPPRHRIVTPEAKKKERTRKKLSASQLEMFGDCKRKWAFRYIDKIEKAPDKSAQLGTRVHAILEEWLRDGLPPNPQETMILPKGREGIPFTYYPGRVAMAGIHHLPPPRIGMVERELSLTTPEADWTGRVDLTFLVSPSGAMLPPSPTMDGLITVADHKSTRDFKWAKTPDILQDDPQAMLYAAEAMGRFRRDTIRLLWVYYRTEDPASKTSDLIVDRAHVESAIKTLDSLAEEMYTLRASGKKAIEIEPNPEACDRYNGCQYKSICPLSNEERFYAAMSGNPKNVQELLAKKRAAGGAPPPPPPPPAAVDTTRAAVAMAIKAGAPDAAILAMYPAAGGMIAELRGAPPPPPPPPAVQPPRPPHWIPGDPMNAAQEWLANRPADQGGPATLAIVAGCADVPPPPEFLAMLAAGGPVAQAAPAPSVGNVNSPEAPPALSGHVPGTPHGVAPPPPPPPPAVDDLTSLNRDQLKAIAVASGLVETNDRSREETLRAKIREARAAGKPVMLGAPPPPPPPEFVAPADGLTYRDRAILAAFSGLVSGNEPDDAATLAIAYGDALNKLRNEP